MPCLASAPVDRLALYSLPGFHEPFSAATHLLGALAFAIAGVPLLRRGGRGDATRLAFLGTYVVSGVFLMSVSGAYHMTAAGGTARAVMLRLGHAAIFVLIAGTFTPVHGLLFRGAHSAGARSRWSGRRPRPASRSTRWPRASRPSGSL